MLEKCKALAKKIKFKWFTTALLLAFIVADYRLSLLNWLTERYGYHCHECALANQSLNEAKDTVKNLNAALNGDAWRFGVAKYEKPESWEYVNNIIYLKNCIDEQDITGFFMKRNFSRHAETSGYCQNNIIFYDFKPLRENTNGLCHEISFYIKWDKNAACA